MRLFTALCTALLTLASLPAQSQENCGVELVLAMDVSRSVNPEEFDLIRHGTAEAFRNEEIIELVGWLKGGVLATVTQWSGPEQQRQMTPWRHLKDAGSLAAFANEIDAMKRVYRFDLTAPGNALAHAASLGQTAPVECRRRVIDISGDGVRNTGLDTGPVADEIAASGVTINGLVVRGATPDPLVYYLAEVKRGPLSFVELSNGYDDFPRAMFRKLLRELTPSVADIEATDPPG